jgi:hypothetical protein
MTFEFGETVESKAFAERHPKFIPAFMSLMDVGNKCFGRLIRPTNRLEDIGFWLGHTCRDDFLEVTFLAVNGHGFAASKILRGLFERAVTLAYLLKHPHKVERFVRYGAIQEHRGMVSALKLVSIEEFDKAMGSGNSAADIQQRYEQIKSEFETYRCSTCKKTKMVQPSWDIDLASMTQDVGEPYVYCYMGSYTIPNFHVHATLASALQGEDIDTAPAKQRNEGEFALVNATILLLAVARSENALFALNLDSDIEQCDMQVADLWKEWSNPSAE